MRVGENVFSTLRQLFVPVARNHAGTVESELSAPFSKNVAREKLFTPDQSAAYLLDVMANLTPENTGRFWASDGTEIDW